jgi:hypothetical protein
MLLLEQRGVEVWWQHRILVKTIGHSPSQSDPA